MFITLASRPSAKSARIVSTMLKCSNVFFCSQCCIKHLLVIKIEKNFGNSFIHKSFKCLVIKVSTLQFSLSDRNPFVACIGRKRSNVHIQFNAMHSEYQQKSRITHLVDVAIFIENPGQVMSRFAETR